MIGPLGQPTAQGGGSVPTVEELAAVLAEVAARREFAPPTKTWLQEQRERFVEWRNELLGRLIEWLGLDGSLAEGFGTWIGFGLLAVLVLAAAWTVSSLLRRRQGVGRRASGPAQTPDGPAGLGRSRALLAAAAEHARRGEYERALRALYAGCVHDLDERGRLRFEERKTAREYARELTGEARESWRRLVGTFEPAVYGERGADRPAWEAAREAADGLGVAR